MKKLIFLGLSALALAGCSSTISNPNQLIGQWQCTIEYDDFNIRTVDNLRFSTNGTMTNQGGIYYPIQKSIFEYSFTTEWALECEKRGYCLSYRLRICTA